MLNAAPSLSTAIEPADADASRGVRTALPAPPNGLALLPVLEQLAQRELARMVASQGAPPITDAAFAGLAWDLGLTGDELDAAGR
jgi:hypothetical protein